MKSTSTTRLSAGFFLATSGIALSRNVIAWPITTTEAFGEKKLAIERYRTTNQLKDIRYSPRIN